MNADTLQAVLEYPWVLKEYDQWLRQRPVTPRGDYLYTQPEVRFNLRDADTLVLNPTDLHLDAAGEHVVSASSPRTSFATQGIPASQVRALLRTLEAQPLVIELPVLSGVPANVCEQFLRIGLGFFVFVPSALTVLENRARAAEVVRFPGSPYEIVRNYWANVVAIQGLLDVEKSTIRTLEQFVLWLRGLHVALLLGPDYASFYCPISPSAHRRVAPGAIYNTRSELISTKCGRFIVEGARVNAAPVGGPRYHEAIAHSLGIDPSGSAEIVFSEGPVKWGELVNARGRSEPQEGPWFLPARPIENAHWEALWRTWSQARDATSVRCCLDNLAQFHWYFVHLHPFSCANQSLAFALINHELNQRVGSGIPQLVMDQLAMRYSREDYARLFARAVCYWISSAASPAERHVARIGRRRTLDQFLTQLSCVDAPTAKKNVAMGEESSSSAAALALLVEPQSTLWPS